MMLMKFRPPPIENYSNINDCFKQYHATVRINSIHRLDDPCRLLFNIKIFSSSRIDLNATPMPSNHGKRRL